MDHKKISTKDKIITAYWQLNEQKKLTVSNICKSAGINRSTFYEYYLDIYDLSNQEEDHIITELITQINNAFPDYIPKDMSEFTKIVIDIFTKYDKKIYLMLNHNSLHFQKKINDELSNRLFTVLGIDPSDIYFKYLTTYVVSNICSLLNCWYENNQELNTEEMVKLIHHLVFNGLLGYATKN